MGKVFRMGRFFTKKMVFRARCRRIQLSPIGGAPSSYKGPKGGNTLPPLWEVQQQTHAG